MSKTRRKAKSPKPERRKPRKRTTWVDREALRAAMGRQHEGAADLARRLNVTGSAVSQILVGRRTVNEDLAAKLGGWYGVPVFLQLHKEYQDVQ